MADPRRPIAVKEPKSHQAGNPTGAIVAPVSGLHPLRPRDQPSQTTTWTQPEVSHRTPLRSHRPPLRPQSRTTQQQPAAKIAIPRLYREPDVASTAGSSVVGDKNRVTHACESCRHRKTKCSGDRPMCKHCEEFSLTCVYEDGKRDRMRKRLENLIEKVDSYEKLLRDLSQRACSTDQRLIRKALEQGSTPDDCEISATHAHQAGVSSIYSGAVGDDNSDEADGETHLSARVGSLESLDHIHEDFNQSLATRATGFMGKNSELTWMQRLKKETSFNSDVNDKVVPTLQTDEEGNSMSPRSDVLATDMTPVNESTYHCDDLTILIPERVDPNEVPPRQIADALFQMYLDSVHSSFPIIGKLNFVNQYQRFLDTPNIVTGDSWKAILNLIFAIGAKYSHLVQAEWRGDERDHLIYFTRARMLGFNADSVLGHSDLQMVQITGLMSFYLTAINQINRAWAISGIAIRHACTLGLNMRNESKDVYESSKEIRYRVWWALFSNEELLSVMTGRPASILDTACAVPLPLPLDEDKFYSVKSPGFNGHNIRMLRRYSSQESHNADNALPTPSSPQSAKSRPSPSSSVSLPPNSDQVPSVPPSHALYFYHHVILCVLTGEVLNRLYRVGTMTQSWAQVQSTIAALDSKLESWHSALPSVFDFTKSQQDLQFSRQRVSLGFFYYSTLTILSRPCLCRMKQTVPNQSEKAQDFNRTTAVKCVEAALGMLDLFPDEPNPIGLYEVAPWWCLVHHLVQAAAVLMLELSFRSDHLPQRVDDVLFGAKKTVCWLRSMSAEDLSARRAWAMCDEMLRKVAPKVGRNVDDLPADSFMYAQSPADGIFGVFPANLETMESLNTLTDMYRPQQPGENMSIETPIFASYNEFLSTQMPYSDYPL